MNSLGYIFHQIVFNGNHWNDHLGENTISEEEIKKSFNLLPPRIWSFLNRACPEITYKKIFETHLLVYIPEALKDEKMTLHNLEKFIKQIDPNLTNKWDRTKIFQFLYNRVIKSGFLLMKRESMFASNRHTYHFQENHIKDLNRINYEIPFFEEAVICIYAEFFRSGTPHFACIKKFSSELGWHNANNFISCKNSVIVGNFDENGLTIKPGKAVHPNRHIGLAPIVRLKPKEDTAPVL